MTDRSLIIHEYLRSLEPERVPLLKELRDFARENFVPIILDESESFLKTLCVIKNPPTILEIGSGIGYSTIVMAYALPNAHITTIESFDKRIPELMENLERARIDKRTKVIHKDASDALKELASEKKFFDFIFLDAAKGQYLNWLPLILKLMKKGSILFADNVLLNETVINSSFLLPHRARSTHKRMREFLFRIKHDKELLSSVLPLGDGISVSVRI